MFEGQPKGLYALALANTGERFGYYTMLAIFTLFLQAKFGFAESSALQIYGGFLAAAYFMPLIGGILADKFGFGKMITTGLAVMFIGYVLLAIPSGMGTVGIASMFGALFLIACGTGLFKGNLQVMVGNLYDNPAYSQKRDTAFSLFYMAINIGALFAPTAAEKITDYFMTKAHLVYDPAIPALAHQLEAGTITDTGRETLLHAATQMGDAFAAQGNDLAQFGAFYINQLSTSYHYAFAVACLSLIVSAAIYFGFRYTFKSADYNSKTANQTNHVEEELTPKQTKDRVVALLLVFAVVIFFWMAFHQNGGTMTLFARDYTNKAVTGFTRFGFDVWNLVLLIIVIYGSFAIAQSQTLRGKLISGAVVILSLAAFFLKYANMPEVVNIQPQIFQHFNPCFVVALTPFSILLFGTLAKKGKEPSAPRKIGLGMLVAAIGFCILAVGSMGQVSPADLKDIGGVSQALVSPNWLISTYLVLTFAELLLSPMGISFVSKVAPPKYKGMMMGGWFVATAIGNYATSIIGHLWSSHMTLWMVWSVLVVLCLLSALFMFAIMKKLEKVAK